MVETSGRGVAFASLSYLFDPGPTLGSLSLLMSNKDMVVDIMNLITQEGVSLKKLRKILDYVERVTTRSSGARGPNAMQDQY